MVFKKEVIGEESRTSSDFRMRDCTLGEVLIKLLVINICMLRRKGWNEVSIIADLWNELCLCSDAVDAFEICCRKLAPCLVGKSFNLHDFSLNQCLCIKSKLLVQKKHPSIAHEIEMRIKDRVHQLSSSRKHKSNVFCLSRFRFMPIIGKQLKRT